jgi:2'-5' RNA ligase
VQNLPETKLKTLIDTQRTMIIKQAKMRAIMTEELRLEVNRFRSGQLKLGSNKSSPRCSPGGVVVLDLAGQAPQLGVVLTMTKRDATVRKQHGGVVSLALGQCIPITPAGDMMGSREGENFTHFVSLEFKQDELFRNFQRKIMELQVKMSEMDGVGKPQKSESLHLTIATLCVSEEETTDLIEKIEIIFKRYIDMMESPCGLSTTFKGIDYGDYGALWLEMSLGEESVKVLREMVEDEVAHLLTDKRFHAHLTIFRGNTLNDEMKETVKAAVKEVRLGGATIAELTLRTRKIGKAPLAKPLLCFKLADKSV